MVPSYVTSFGYRQRSPTAPRSSAGILTRFSFVPRGPAAAALGCPSEQLVSPGLPKVSLDTKIPANPQTTAVVEEPTSTSVFIGLRMNTCYYHQDLLPWPVHELSTTRFNPTRVSALLVYPD